MEVGWYPGWQEIDQAIETAAWQYGEASVYELAEQIAGGHGCSDREIEELAVAVNRVMQERNEWECLGNRESEAYYLYHETAAFCNLRSLSQIPRDASARHRRRVYEWLLGESRRMSGESKRTLAYQILVGRIV